MIFPNVKGKGIIGRSFKQKRPTHRLAFGTAETAGVRSAQEERQNAWFKTTHFPGRLERAGRNEVDANHLAEGFAD